MSWPTFSPITRSICSPVTQPTCLQMTRPASFLVKLTGEYVGLVPGMQYLNQMCFSNTFRKTDKSDFTLLNKSPEPYKLP